MERILVTMFLAGLPLLFGACFSSINESAVATDVGLGYFGKTLINEGSSYSNKTSVKVVFEPEQATYYAIHDNENECERSPTWKALPYDLEEEFTLSNLNGTNSMYIRFKSGNKASPCVLKTIIHDDQEPNSPTNIKMLKATSGSITPDVKWSDADDVGSSGSGVAYYEVAYFRENGDIRVSDWVKLEENGTMPNTAPSINTSPHYVMVRSVDRAGNRSEAVKSEDMWVSGFMLEGRSDYVASNLKSYGFNITSWEFKDVNSDGFIDLVAMGKNGIYKYSNEIYILINDGNGKYNFDESVFVTRFEASPLAYDSGDIDGDGDLDFVIYKTGEDCIDADNYCLELLRNTGSFNYSSEEIDFQYYGLMVGFHDLEGNGKEDFIITRLDRSPNPDLQTFYALSDTGGVASIAASFEISENTTSVKQVLEMKNLDGDAHLELVTIDTYTDKLEVRDWDGTSYVTKISVSTNYTDPLRHVGDVDNDGFTDLVYKDGQVYYKLSNDGSSNFVKSQLWDGTSISESRVEFKDINSNGYVDIVYYSSSKFYYVLDDGAGSYLAPVELHTSSSTCCDFAIKILDFDNDSNMDIYVHAKGSVTNEVYIYFNDGTESFTQHKAFEMLVDESFVLDIDNSGSSDVVVFAEDSIHSIISDGGSGSSRIITRSNFKASFNSETLSFDSLTPQLFGQSGHIYRTIEASSNRYELEFVEVCPFTASNIVSLEFDVDHDGNQDMLFICSDGIRYYRNLGDYTYNREANISSLVPQNILIKDIDGDGDDDIYTTGSILSLFRNDGPNNLVQINLSSGGNFKVRFEDLDSDGDIDVIEHNWSNYRLKKHLNDGAGSYTSSNLLSGIGLYVYDIIDVNGDLHKDVVYSPQSDSTTLSVAENDGSLNFTSSFLFEMGSQVYGIFGFFFNEDNKGDMIVTSIADSVLMESGTSDYTNSFLGLENPHMVGSCDVIEGDPKKIQVQFIHYGASSDIFIY